jgi:hypothetical protein
MVPSLDGCLISFDFVVSVVVSVGCSGGTFVPTILSAFLRMVSGFTFVSKYFSTSAATWRPISRRLAARSK